MIITNRELRLTIKVLNDKNSEIMVWGKLINFPNVTNSRSYQMANTKPIIHFTVQKYEVKQMTHTFFLKENRNRHKT